ncbi:SMB domain-containing protein [Trichonephila clavipes]|nr:SMB domain-containing protein [Trichonephila clavipes]
MPYGKLSGVGAYVVGSCPFDYMGPEKLKGLCEDKDDFHDPFFSTPVTDMSTNVTYRNRYCVECNGALPSSLKSWIISVGFKHLPTHYPSEEFIWKYLSFHPLMRKWGIRTARRFYPCYFSFHKPDYISAVRPCRPNLITTCQSDWTNVGVKRACESYTSVVHVLGRSYRNIQCAVCNGEILKQLSCTKSPMHTKIESIPLVFEMMVDFNSKKSTTEGYKKEKCEPGSVLDRFFKKCRGFECAFPNYTFNDGKFRTSGTLFSDAEYYAVGPEFESRRRHRCLQMYSALSAWGYSKLLPNRTSSRDVGERYLTTEMSSSKLGWNRVILTKLRLTTGVHLALDRDEFRKPRSNNVRQRILFSDEAHFWLNGYVNKQNCRIWSEANPRVYVETPLHPEKLTVWCALWAGGILLQNDEGHNVTVNGDRSRAMITNFFIPELNNHDVQELWFQQDGATCHTARATIDLLKDTFGDRLISRFGPVNWPPRSCDLTPLDYFL